MEIYRQPDPNYFGWEAYLVSFNREDRERLGLSDSFGDGRDFIRAAILDALDRAESAGRDDDPCADREHDAVDKPIVGPIEIVDLLQQILRVLVEMKRG